jgi:hypothetical protein
VNLSAQALSGLQPKANLLLFPPMGIRQSLVDPRTATWQEQHGYSLAQAACGASKGVNLSAQVLSGTQCKALLLLFPPMGIRQSLVDTPIAPMREQYGYSLVQAACGASKGANLSAQALLRVHIKAGLSLFPPMEIRQSLVGAVTTPMQGQHGYSLVQAACGASKVASLSAQALSGLHIKAGLSLFPPMEIRQSLVGALTASLREQHGYSLVQAACGASKGANLSAQALSGLHIKAILLLFPPMGIRQWLVGTVTTSSEQYGYSHEAERRFEKRLQIYLRNLLSNKTTQTPSTRPQRSNSQ